MSKKKTKAKLINIQDRITDFRRIPATDLQDNKGNWREHPQAQRDSLRSILEGIGIADALTVYYSKRNDGALTLIDGHLRKDDYDQVDWPVLILNVNDSEADALMATFDPIAMMARTNEDRLQGLRDRLRDNHANLQGTFDRINEGIGFFDNIRLKNIKFPEFDEGIGKDVIYIECPHCGKEFPR